MKFDFKLAVKDKRLIYTLIIAAIIIAAFFGYRAIDKQVDDLDKKHRSLILFTRICRKRLHIKMNISLKQWFMMLCIPE